MKINFLTEIEAVLKENNKSITDIKWIGNSVAVFDTKSFLDWAGTFNYDNGYGLEVIPLDYIIVGNDWWLERAEYDGSEWWEFKRYPVKNDRVLYFSSMDSAIKHFTDEMR